MPINKELEGFIPKLYRRQALDLLMFGYISGMKAALPSMTIDESIESFREHYGLKFDDIDVDSARTTYYRMMNEFLHTKKQN